MYPVFNHSTPIFYFLHSLCADDEKSDKGTSRISSARRKRKQTNDKPTLSESSDDDGDSNTSAKTRRSRSQSTEVLKKRGRPRKVPLAAPVDVIEPPKQLPQKATVTPDSKLTSPSTLKTTPKKESAKRTPVRQRNTKQTNSKGRANTSSKGAKNPISKGELIVKCCPPNDMSTIFRTQCSKHVMQLIFPRVDHIENVCCEFNYSLCKIQNGVLKIFDILLGALTTTNPTTFFSRFVFHSNHTHRIFIE